MIIVGIYLFFGLSVVCYVCVVCLVDSGLFSCVLYFLLVLFC